jgi:uncharacterized membrane protein
MNAQTFRNTLVAGAAALALAAGAIALPTVADAAGGPGVRPTGQFHGHSGGYSYGHRGSGYNGYGGYGYGGYGGYYGGYGYCGPIQLTLGLCGPWGY